MSAPESAEEERNKCWGKQLQRNKCGPRKKGAGDIKCPVKSKTRINEKGSTISPPTKVKFAKQTSKSVERGEKKEKEARGSGIMKKRKEGDGSNEKKSAPG